MILPQDATDFNILAFLYVNNIVNEYEQRIEFHKHYFMIDPYNDMSPNQVIMKAAQVGWSTLAILKALWLAKNEKVNIIYTMPSGNSIKDFVRPKVDPIIKANPIIESWLGKTDSAGLKQVGKNFIYFRGSFDPDSAISISSHILINDEVDRSNPKTLRTFRSRLDAAKFDRPDMGWIWEFSNPSINGAGVDAAFQDSDQKHWFVKCRSCSFEWYLKWPESVDIENECYICSKCHNPLTDEDRRTGRWVNKFSGRDISGYWISQMQVPVISAKKIIRESKGDPAVFHNFTLGLPYVSKDQQITREAIVKCLSPDTNPQTDVAIGVDVGVLKHYVIGNKYGIFKIGATESWQEIENMRNRFNATMVIDGNPYPHEPRKLIEKYAGKVFMHYFNQDRHNAGIVRWGEHDKFGIVESDRTKIIDAVVADITSEDVTYQMSATELEPYINHAVKLYRTTRTAPNGSVIPVWETIEGADDHFFFAHIYFKIALEKAAISSGIINSSRDDKEPVPYGHAGKTLIEDNLDEAIQRSIKPQKDWKSI